MPHLLLTKLQWIGRVMDLLAMEGYAMHDYIHAGNAHYIQIFGKFQQAALGRLGRSGCTSTTVLQSYHLSRMILQRNSRKCNY